MSIIGNFRKEDKRAYYNCICDLCSNSFTRRADKGSTEKCNKCIRKEAGEKISKTKLLQNKLKPAVYCCVDGCDRVASYKNDKLCQKHYFRRMRYGTFELTQIRKYRIENPAGYQKLYEPTHPLSNKDGYVYEHRMVYYNSGQSAEKCSICDCKINWKVLHIDHIDKNVKNNDLSNLRPTCRNCNTFRDLTTDILSDNFIECRGLRLTLAQWARRSDVKVAYQTIRHRLIKGETPEEAIFGKRKTHQNTKTKKVILNYYKD